MITIKIHLICAITQDRVTTRAAPRTAVLAGQTCYTGNVGAVGGRTC